MTTKRCTQFRAKGEYQEFIYLCIHDYCKVFINTDYKALNAGSKNK